MHEDLEGEIQEPLESVEGVFIDLAEAAIIPPTWVLKDLIPVGLTFLAAPPKAGKSTLTMGIAALIAGYKTKTLPTFLREVPEEGPVMVFSYEAEAGELKHMVQSGLGIELVANESILIADNPWRYRLDDPDGLSTMMYWLNTRRPKMVILDPLVDFHRANENDSGEMNRLLRPLRTWAVKNNAAFVVVHHTKKPGEGHQKYDMSDMRGTGALFGIADGILIATPSQKISNCLNIKAKFKRAREWERQIQLAAYEDLERPAGELLSQVDMDAQGAMSRGAINVEQVAMEAKLTLQVAREALLKLKRNGLADVRDNVWRLCK